MWYAKAIGGYANNSVEGLANVTEMAQVMAGYGWSVPAMAAMLGNGAGEGGLNPWRWENDDILASTDSYNIDVSDQHGYGLFGFTPAGRYIHDGWAQAQPTYAPNFSDIPGRPEDGACQMQFFAREVEPNWSHESWLHDYYYDDFAALGIDIDDFFYMSFADFVAGNDTLANLVGAFELCYEKPRDDAAASSYIYRIDDAIYWQGVLQGMDFGGEFIWLKKKWRRKKIPIIY